MLLQSTGTRPRYKDIWLLLAWHAVPRIIRPVILASNMLHKGGYATTQSCGYLLLHFRLLGVATMLT